ncbi:MAG: ATP phosphoribosyltransferase regulatory subunit [Nanoarchaeota archaeon]
METVKGFRDIEYSGKRIEIRNIIENTFKLYNFKPVETPTLEYEEFVKSNNPNDEAVSNTFRLEDQGKRKLALRYEFTFQLKRLAVNKKLPYRRYQIGQVFRDEPITGNRWREFTQCDVDIIGSNFKDEAGVLKITSEILKKLKINFIINFNNRKLLEEILEELKIVSKDKEQVIREIDKLDKLPEKEVFENLKKLNAERILSVFKKPKNYFKKYKSFKEIEELKNFCKLYKVKVNFQPFLARGLSYYNRSIFEVKSKIGIKETIAAGGSYLINNIQSTGISFGLDRLELLAKIKIPDKKILVISLNQDKKSVSLDEKIRKLNIPCQIFYGKPGKALDYANSYKIPLVIFIGEEEAKKKKYKFKNMKNGREKLVGERELLKYLEKN